MVFTLVAAALFSLGGAGALFFSWRQRLARNPVLAPGGWLLLILAMVCWVVATSPEIGVLLGLLMPSLAAWVFVTINREVRTRRSERNPAASTDEVAASPGADFAVRATQWKRHILLFVLAFPVAGAGMALFTIALANLLPWSELNRTALIVLLMPVLWGVAAAWLCSDERLRRPVTTVVLLGAVSALLVF